MNTQVSLTVEGLQELLNSYMFWAEERLFNTKDGGNMFFQNFRTFCTTTWLLQCFQNSNIHILFDCFCSWVQCNHIPTWSWWSPFGQLAAHNIWETIPYWFWLYTGSRPQTSTTTHETEQGDGGSNGRDKFRLLL